MSRHIQNPNGKGSLKWIQELINKHPDLLSRQLKKLCELSEAPEWVSPLKIDEYAEYRDDEFLKVLKSDSKIKIPLERFWPKKGPAMGCDRENKQRCFFD